LESIGANFGVKILTSSCYTCKELRAMPTSSLGGASTRVDHVQKSPFYASLWQFTVWYRMLTLPSNVGSVKLKAKLSTNQERSLRLLWPWNDDSL